MVLVKVLKRKDAASVLVAVVLALIISSYLPSLLFEVSSKISGVESLYGTSGGDWKNTYLQPTVLFILEVLLLEVLARIFIALRGAWIKNRQLMASSKLWFKARKYGWGWTPVTWQGWACIITYTVLCILAGVLLIPHFSEELGVVYITAFGLFIISLTSFLVGISYRKGEPPSWQWGSQPKKSESNKNETK
jgi:hypothetical protein